ncbi:MAG: PLP-dependent aminotransferase family protein [Candidatus Aminicenantes bacterium]|nr:PLP-dependent aminotransferase family protein [Candidatus Aminicenantes bacterium]
MAFSEQMLSRTTRSMGVSFIREMLKATKGVEGMISLAGGLPSPDSFPKDLLAGLFKEVVETEGADVLQYGPSEGDDVLKAQILRHEGDASVGHDEILITDGTTNAIYFFTRSVIDPGDIVICEAPSFNGSLVAIEACGAELVAAPMDEDGLIVEAVREEIRAQRAKGRIVKYVYTIPEFQNPSGRTMSLARRRDLIRTAREAGILILEDQPYRDLRFYGERLPSLWNLARTEFDDDATVTICKSFSKILGPGLRLGFAVGPAPLIAAMAKWAQKVIVSPEGVVQRVTARFLERGYMAPHMARIKELYRSKRDTIISALKEAMPSSVRWTEPEGGLFIWVTCPATVDTDVLFFEAAKAGVAFIPGAKFYLAGAERKNEMRLNFSYAPAADLREGVARLARLLGRP